MKIVGQGLERLVESLRRQVIYDIQAFRVSDVKARVEAHGVERVQSRTPAEPEELGDWAGSVIPPAAS